MTGYRHGIYRRTDTTLKCPSVATNTAGATVTGDTAVDIRNAKNIVLQIDSAATTYASNDFDINVLTRCEATTTYDTVAWASINSLASAAVKSTTIAVGPGYLKIQVDNNSTTAKCAPQIIVQVVA